MAPMARVPKWVKCERCGRRATLGLPSSLAAQFVRNAAINEKTRDQFRFVFGKKKSSKFRTTADIDAAFQDVTRRYPHLAPGYRRGVKYDLSSAADLKKLGTPGEVSRDPFPRERITDSPRINPERRVM